MGAREMLPYLLPHHKSRKAGLALHRLLHLEEWALYLTKAAQYSRPKWQKHQ